MTTVGSISSPNPNATASKACTSGVTKKENVELRVVRLEGQLAFAAHVGGAVKPSYFILLEFEAGRVESIRDFRYVPYIAAEAEFEPVALEAPATS